MAIYCSNCGAELPDGVAYCDACGSPVRGQNRSTFAAPQPQASPVSQAQPQAAPIGSVACPVCGAAALPGEAFCDNCGAALLAPASFVSSEPSPQPVQQQVVQPAPSYSSSPMGSSYTPIYQAPPATASLVVSNPPPPATIPVPARAELIVGRSDPQSNSYPDVDLGPYGGLDLGVSRRHFRLTRNGDQFYIEDLGSVNGTVINGQRIQPHALQPLRPGDRVLLGKMELVFDLS